jgi:hypothetical protein
MQRERGESVALSAPNHHCQLAAGERRTNLARILKYSLEPVVWEMVIVQAVKLRWRGLAVQARRVQHFQRLLLVLCSMLSTAGAPLKSCSFWWASPAGAECRRIAPDDDTFDPRVWGSKVCDQAGV